MDLGFASLATAPRTAIVTGGARRIGAALVRALADDGWHLLIHCRESETEADGLAGALPHARVVTADLAAAGAAEAILASTRDMPPPGLLVNSASGFAHDTLDTLEPAQWDAHLGVNLRAPAFLTRAFAAAVPQGMAGLVVNMLDAKLSALNTDFFSYTVSKMGLAAFTELAARELAPRRIRVCGIAPAVTLVSGPQSAENFTAVHALNPLGRGVAVADIVRTLRFIVDTPVLTGQTITLDAGQRFLGLTRDVQFLTDQPGSTEA